MQTFREKYLLGPMSAFTAFIFLNMGFFMLEVKLLGLDEDRQLSTNISTLINTVAFEEERDSNTQSSTLNFAEEEYMAGHHSTTHSISYFLIAGRASCLHDSGNLQSGYLSRFYPPPEI